MAEHLSYFEWLSSVTRVAWETHYVRTRIAQREQQRFELGLVQRRLLARFAGDQVNSPCTQRGAALAGLARNAEGDLLVSVALASEAPYERWWGVEVLDCGASAIRLDSLNSGAPVLFNHNWNDLRGVHIPGTVRADDDKVLRGKLRITAATQIGRDTIALVETGMLSKASVGYRIHQVAEQVTDTQTGRLRERLLPGHEFARLLKQPIGRHAFQRALDARFGAFERGTNKATIYRVIDWEPYESSLVTVPADNSVGVGRLSG